MCVQMMGVYVCADDGCACVQMMGVYVCADDGCVRVCMCVQMMGVYVCVDIGGYVCAGRFVCVVEMFHFHLSDMLACTSHVLM